MVPVRFLGLVLVLILSIPLYAQENNPISPSHPNEESEVSKLDSLPPGQFVVFKSDTLFPIYSNLGPYGAEERAQIITNRLKRLSKEESWVNKDSFHLEETNRYIILNYKDQAIFSIGESDADYAGIPKEELSDYYLTVVQSTFEQHSERVGLKDWLLNITFTILAAFGLYLIFRLLKKLFAWINVRLEKYESGLKRKRKSLFKYLVPKESSNIFLVASKIIRFGLSLLILFLYLPFLFSFLPWTRGLAEKFYSYISDPVSRILNGLVNFIPNLFSIAVIILIARYFLKVLTFVSKEIEEGKLKIKGFHQDWSRPTFNLVKIIIYILAAVFTVQYLPASPAFKGVSIFVGVLFTLGSTSAIANMIAGIVITYMRPFAIGDRVKIGETMGDVIEKNLLVTRLRTVKNEDITIPNATIINTHLWNYSKNASEMGIILHPTITIGYDVASEQVVELLLNAAKNTKNLTRDFKPFVLQKSLNDFYVEYELNVYTKQPKKMAHFYSELNKNILHEFNAAGVEILSPHYSAYRDGNESTVINDVPTSQTDPVGNAIDKITGK